MDQYNDSTTWDPFYLVWKVKISIRKNALERHHRLHTRKAILPDTAPQVARNLVKTIASNTWDKIENNLQQAMVG